MPSAPQLHPHLGFGLGLRTAHYEAILSDAANTAGVDWFEIISENYMVPGGRPLHHLDRVRERFPLAMHGVSLSIGSTDPLSKDYLRDLKTLADRVQPTWISDHLCWTGAHGTNMHDLLPLPYTEETVRHVAQRVEQVQEALGRRLLIENVSSYITYNQSEMTEWEFLMQIVERADCLILLDINNIYVSGFNHDFDPLDYLRAIPVGRVQQFHIAGHENHGNYIIDTHDAAVIDPVWELYSQAVRRFGNVSAMIERDDKIPPLAELIAELGQARRLADAAMSTKEPARASSR